MNSIKDIFDEKVRRLAETLRQSGLAASETEAVRMALSMTNTGNRVNQTFDERKDKNIMGLSNLNKPQATTQQSTTQPHNSRPIQQPTQPTQQVQREPLRAQQEIHQQHTHKVEEPLKSLKEEDCNCGPECECGHDCNCSHYEEETEEIELIEQELVEEPKSEQKPVQKEELKKEFVKINTPERAPPKKDISQMQESKVDLSKVFNFTKR